MAVRPSVAVRFSDTGVGDSLALCAHFRDTGVGDSLALRPCVAVRFPDTGVGDSLALRLCVQVHFPDTGGGETKLALVTGVRVDSPASTGA